MTAAEQLLRSLPLAKIQFADTPDRAPEGAIIAVSLGDGTVEIGMALSPPEPQAPSQVLFFTGPDAGQAVDCDVLPMRPVVDLSRVLELKLNARPGGSRSDNAVPVEGMEVPIGGPMAPMNIRAVCLAVRKMAARGLTAARFVLLDGERVDVAPGSMGAFLGDAVLARRSSSGSISDGDE